MKTLHINKREIVSGKVYVISEMSANHNQDFEQAKKIIFAAKAAGADAVKVQTYTPDTLTIDCDNEYFRIKGTSWEGKTLYQLYGEAATPWEWQPDLKEYAESLGLDFFSTPFDETAVDFLESINVPAYKIASFELVDLPLLRKVAKTGKPIILSTGMATLEEIEEAVQAISEAGGEQLALLKCTSAYPAPPEDANLKTIADMASRFNLPVGLSDHTMGSTVAVAAVALGACIIEKHLTLSRNIPGPDSFFSMEPDEFKTMVDSIRTVEKAFGSVEYGVSEAQEASKVFRRSLFVVQDMKKGEKFTMENVRSIRPGYGLHTRYYDDIIGRMAVRSIRKGTPLKWDLVLP